MGLLIARQGLMVPPTVIAATYIPILADFPTQLGTNGAGTILSDESDHMLISIDTDDAKRSITRQRARTLADGGALVWKCSSDLPASNYHSARGVAYDSSGARLEFGDVYDAGLKKAVTNYSSGGSWNGHRWGPSATHNGKEWHRITRSGSSLIFAISSDGSSWTDLLTTGWTMTDFGFSVVYTTTTVVGDTVEGRLYRYDYVPP